MSAKVIFLDVDGVLNSGEYFQRVGGALDLDMSNEGLLNHLDPEACARLQQLLARTGAKLVLSSSWRGFLDASEMQRLLREKGVVSCDFLGETPRPRDVPENKGRGSEIQAWLDRTSLVVERFVILDDNSDMLHLSDRLVQTDYDVGLTDADVNKAAALLGDV